MDPYRFSERTASGDLDDQARDWLAAVRLGFNEGRGSDETIRRWWKTASADGQRWRSAHRDQPLDELGMGSLPVATLASLDHRINVGGQLVTARYITDVTVRTTDRRQGLLRRMMSDELTQARAEGCPVASLTATEAGIYGRFGFGVALRRQSVEVALDGRFRLRHAPRATVEAADPS
ncbi:GNAT family N-acetyltransferase, partial [Luteococcus sp.]|uniref:GNAT family N-acetyltransferase n=1 Tax=Luteococcus sp. TaxID=1969402 RepID=UPI003734D46C